MSDEKTVELSIEETNKLREKLGLKPLKVKEKKKEEVVNKEEKELNEKKLKTEELRLKLENSKKKQKIIK